MDIVNNNIIICEINLFYLTHVDILNDRVLTSLY